MRGGKRQGAGRKKGFAAKNAEEARRVLSEMVMREIAPIGEALIAKAKAGDVVAAREVLDRAFGKPITQAIVYDEKRDAIEEDRKALAEILGTLHTRNKQ